MRNISHKMNRQEFIEKRHKMSQEKIEKLLELLSSDNLQTRFFAEMALRDKTST